MKVRFALFCMAAGLTGLSACEQPLQGSGHAAAAKIGGEAISEAELNMAMSRLDALDRQTALNLRGQVLDALIDQRLLSALPWTPISTRTRTWSWRWPMPGARY